MRALEVEKKRRDRFRFDKANIPVGSVLVFTRDEAVTAIVAENNKVLFRGEVMSVSLAANKALADHNKTWSTVQGTIYWMFEGETLDERRERLSDEDDSDADE